MRTINLPAIALVVLAAACSPSMARERWTPAEAQEWDQTQPWFVGCNFSPSTAINQLEMWQSDSFDIETIDRELGWAESLGFNSVRVFLHDLLWKHDEAAFVERIEKFLAVADRHGIGVVLVPLDGVWDPRPALGPQRAPRPGIHNSGWVQSPGAALLGDPARHEELRPYIVGLVGRFRNDRRVQAWDLFNEPDNGNVNSYGANGSRQELPNKAEMATSLLKQVFGWARSAEPSQPLTSGVWLGPWPEGQKLLPIEQVQLDESDIVSFHNYGDLGQVRERVEQLKRYQRPMLCTEFMARPAGSRFEPILEYLRDQKVGAYCWGFVDGKTQTVYPWDSWQKPYPAPPELWFHDIYRADGTPFDPAEIEYIRRVTGR